MPASLRTPIRTLSATLHRVVGTTLFHIGILEHARRHFERVLELRGEDFGAYVRLALIAYRLGDFASWQRECGHAYRLDAARYARLKHPFELFEGRDSGRGGSDSPPWRRSVRVSRFASAREATPFDGVLGDGVLGDGALADGGEVETGATARGRGAEAAADERADVLRAPLDDFASDAERAHFRFREPIRAEEVRATDVDDLARRLTAG